MINSIYNSHKSMPNRPSFFKGTSLLLSFSQLMGVQAQMHGPYQVNFRETKRNGAVDAALCLTFIIIGIALLVTKYMKSAHAYRQNFNHQRRFSS